MKSPACGDCKYSEQSKDVEDDSVWCNVLSTVRLIDEDCCAPVDEVTKWRNRSEVWERTAERLRAERDRCNETIFRMKLETAAGLTENAKLRRERDRYREERDGFKREVSRLVRVVIARDANVYWLREALEPFVDACVGSWSTFRDPAPEDFQCGYIVPIGVWLNARAALEPPDDCAASYAPPCDPDCDRECPLRTGTNDD